MNVFSIAAILVGLSAFFGYVNYRLLRRSHTIGLVVIALAASLSVIGIDLIDPSVQISQRLVTMLRQSGRHQAL